MRSVSINVKKCKVEKGRGGSPPLQNYILIKKNASDTYGGGAFEERIYKLLTDGAEAKEMGATLQCKV